MFDGERFLETPVGVVEKEMLGLLQGILRGLHDLFGDLKGAIQQFACFHQFICQSDTISFPGVDDASGET